VELTGSLCSQKEELTAIVSKIDAIYLQVKKGEQAPKADAMSMDVPVERSSRERSAAKLTIMNQLLLTGTDGGSR
jgi:hypothetical protein